jgi:hypothetical protein
MNAVLQRNLDYKKAPLSKGHSHKEVCKVIDLIYS